MTEEQVFGWVTWGELPLPSLQPVELPQHLLATKREAPHSTEGERDEQSVTLAKHFGCTGLKLAICCW